MAQSIVVPSGDRLEFPDGMPDSEIEKVIHAEYPDLAPKPSLMKRAGNAISGALAPGEAAAPGEQARIAGLMDAEKAKVADRMQPRMSVPGSVLDQVPVAKMPATDSAAIDNLGVPVTPEFMNRVRRQMDAAAPERRAVLASRPDMFGRAATEILRQQQSIDQTASSGEALTGKTAAVRALDTRKEARSAALASQGLDPQFTQGIAQIDAAAGADATIGGVDTSNFDFETAAAYKDANPIVKGAAAGVTELGKQGVAIHTLINEALGRDEMAGKGRAAWDALGRKSEAINNDSSIDVTTRKGSAGKYLGESLGHAVTSVITNAPGLALSFATGGGGAGLMLMAGQVGADEVLNGRKRGLSNEEALARGVIYGWAEAVGEKFGLDSFKAFWKEAAKGVKTSDLPAFLATHLKREIPGELLTTNIQYGTDVGYGLEKPNLERYLQQNVDTVVQTLMQGGMMSAGGAVLQKSANAIRPEQDLTAGMQFNPDAIDAYARQQLDPANAQMRQVGTRAAPVQPPASPRAELAAVLSGNQPVAEILAAQAPAAAPPQATPQAPLQPAAFGWPDIKTPAVATLPDGQIITGQIAGIQDSDGQPMARFVGADGQVWMIQPGEADIKPAPAAAKRQRKSAFVSSQQFSVDTEDNGKFDVTVHRTASGDVVVNHPDGLMEYKAAFANGKTDAELLAYGFEPVGFRNAAQAPAGDGTRTAPVQAETAEHVKIAEQQVDTNPTEAMKDAGNYKLGHLAIQGLDIAIENPAGSVRSGVDKAGKPWANTLRNTYGYIKGATAADGDKLDAFIGPDPQSQQVFVIDQIDPDTGRYDEAKTMLGFNSLDEARAAYLSNYDAGWKGVGAITPLSMPAFKAWIAKGETHKPLAYDQKAAIAERKAAADTQKAGEAYAAEREKAVAAIGEDQVSAIEDQVADQNAGQPTIELYRAIATALKAEAARQATKPAAQPAQTPSVPSAQPEPVAAAAPSLGFIEAFGSLKNGGATENLISKAFDALKAGKTTISGIKDPILSRAKPAFDAGLIQSAADLKRFEQDGYPTPKQLEMKARAAKNIDAYLNQNAAGRWQLSQPIDDADLRSRVIDEMDRRNQGEVNAQDQAVQSQPAVQDLPQAAPEAGALQGELTQLPAEQSDTGIAGENSPEAKASLVALQNNRNAIDVPNGGRVDSLVPWNDLPNGFAFREYRFNGSARQEIRSPNGAIITRGLDSNGKPYAELEATGTLGDVMSGKAFSEFEKYFNNQPANAPAQDKAPTAPEERAYTKGQAEVLARRMTNQGLPSEAYPHPTQDGMWAIRVPGEEQPADVRDLQTANDKSPDVDFEAMFDEVLAEESQAAPTTVSLPQAVSSAISGQMGKQKRRMMRLNTEAKADNLDLQGKLEAQTKAKAAEASLTAMRTKVFAAEDAAAKAIAEKDLSAFAEFEMLFPDAHAEIAKQLGVSAAPPTPKQKEMKARAKKPVTPKVGAGDTATVGDITEPSITRRANPGNMGDQSFVARSFLKKGNIPIRGEGATEADALLNMMKDADQVMAGSVKPEEVGAGEASKPFPTWATDHEEDVAGRIVFANDEVALLEGFSIMHGRPVYTGVHKNGKRTTIGISSYTGNLFTPEQKQILIDAEAAHRAEDEKANAANPDGPFKNGRFAVSANTPEWMAETAKAWIDMLGIDARIYLTTVDDARNETNMHGPYAAIRSAGVNNGENGSARQLSNGDFYISIVPRNRRSADMETLAHEIGHILEKTAFASATKEEKSAITADYQKWLETAKNTKSAEWVKQLRAHTSGKLLKPEDGNADTLSPYWRSFSEYFADQVSRWATTTEKPLSVAGKFFKRIVDAMRRLYTSAHGTPYLPTKAMKDYLDARDKHALPSVEVGPAPTIAKSTKSAVVNTAKGLDDAINGLGKLFGGTPGTLGMGPVFNEDTYAQAKPLFASAVAHFKDAGQDLKEVMRAVIRMVQERFGPGVTGNMRPYIIRFMEDVKAGNVVYDGSKEDVGNATASTDTETAGSLPGIPEEGLSPDEGGRKPGKVPRNKGAVSDRRDGNADGTGDLFGPGAGDSAGGPVPAGTNAKPGADGIRGDVPPAQGAKPDSLQPERRVGDYVITDATRLGEGGAKTKFRNNVAAIRLIAELDETARPVTAEDQDVLARYVGWGMLPQAFDPANQDWSKEHAELKGLLNQEEWDAAFMSTRYAHYTSEEIITNGVYAALERFGFSGGRILEPGSGVGNFVGLMPTSMRTAGSRVTGIEREWISAKIGQYLYPTHNMLHADFTEFQALDGYFDAAIGNPPFAATALTDASGRKHLSGLSIHNYFFAKSIDMLRENGVFAMVVSNSFLDAARDNARRYIGERTRFLGAIRLPNNAFKKNAGTEVTTDIIFLQKLPDADVNSKATKEAAKAWMDLETIPDPLGGEAIPINAYFKAHPEMMLGRMERSGTMYRGGMSALVAKEGANITEQLREAIARLPQNVYVAPALAATKKAQDRLRVALEDDTVQPGGYYTKDGRLYIRLRDEAGEKLAEEITPKSAWTEKTLVGDGRFARLVAIADLRRTVRQLLAAEIRDDAAEMKRLRKQLNTQYDAIVKEWDFLNAKGTIQLIGDDPDYPLLAALETDYKKGIDAKTAKAHGVEAVKPSAKKMPIFTQRVIPVHVEVTKADTPVDALMISIYERGHIDQSYISALLGGRDAQAIIDELVEQEHLFLDPELNHHVLKDEYLSGNVRRKLKIAQAAGMNKNARALERVIPEDVPSHNIIGKMGANWISNETYQEFIDEQLGEGTTSRIKYQATAGSFIVEIKAGSDVANTNTLGINVDGGRATDLIEKILNKKQIKLGHYDDKGKFHLDKEATDNATDKATEIKTRFADWLFRDAERSAFLTRAYNDAVNNYVVRKYDGALLSFPGKVPDSIIKFRRHQRNAIARILQSGQALLDHVVGAGKTFTIVAAAMEMRRTGLAHKPMVVVPNHLVKQWASDFYRLYPGAKVLAATKNDFQRENRRAFMAKIATGDWDAVIIAHSSFGFIRPDPAFEAEFNGVQIQEITDAINELGGEVGKKDSRDKSTKRTVKQLAAMREKLQERIKALRQKPMDNLLDLAELGVDALFVDEAHAFKNLMFTTKMQGVRVGGDPSGSQRAYDMYLKTHQIMKKNGGRGVVFATGTPISNTMAEMYHILRYLAPETLTDMGLKTFDAWADSFASAETFWMQSMSGEGYKSSTRLEKFVNVPSLLKVYDQVADTVTMDDIKDAYREENDGKEFPIPAIKGGKSRTPVSIKRSDAQTAYMADVAKRAKALEQRKGPPQKGEDNMLSIMGDARKAAMDIRLVDHSIVERDPEGRIAIAAGNILERYQQFDAVKGTQLVFSDMGTPKKTATKELKEYQELKDRADKLDDQALQDRATLGDAEAKAVLDDAEDAVAAIDAKGKDWLDAIKAAMRGFSIYDDLKQALIEKGIPDYEIAFIHDYNTDDQKAALFKAVNSGKIRVVMGSTPKMGAGTNVQERLVALHHLDIPWRPSDVEQREGRIVRQGNKLLPVPGEPRTIDHIDGFEVEILAYATQDTLDLYMWQTQENKLKMIGQLRTGNVDIEMDNAFEEMEFSAGEMQAAATSNPYLLDEIRLKDRIKKLERQKRSHEGQANDIINRGKQARKEVGFLPAEIKRGETLARGNDKYLDLIRETDAAMSATVQGKEVAGREAIMTTLKETIDAMRTSVDVEINGTAFKASSREQFKEMLGEIQNKAEEDIKTVTIAGEEIKTGAFGLKETNAFEDALDKTAHEKIKVVGFEFAGKTYRSYSALAEAVRAFTGDRDRIIFTVAGKDYTQRSKIDAAIRPALERAIDGESRELIGEFAGTKVYVEAVPDRKDAEKVILNVQVEHDGASANKDVTPSGTWESQVEPDQAKNMGPQIVAMARRLMDNARSDADYSTSRMEKAKRTLADVESRGASAEWDGEADLKEARKKYEEILKKLAGKDKELKAAAAIKHERMPPLGMFESLEDDQRSAVSRAIDRAIAIEQGKDVKPLQVIRVRNRIGKLRAEWEAGMLTQNEFIAEVEKLHAQMELAAESRRYAPTNGRARGADFLRQKLLEAKRRGDISEQAADMAEWFILKNPALVEDLGIGIRTPSENQRASGNYNPLNRVMTLFKESASDTTAIHEILHHLERMMPAEMQAEIRKEWLRAVTGELQKAQTAKDQKRIAYFEAVLVGNMARATKLLTGEMGWFNAVEPAPTFKAVDTGSAEFLRWFGDSKVVDADGNPLRVYHGSPSSETIIEFRHDRKDTNGVSAGAFWLTTSKSYAKIYADKRGKGLGQVLPLYVSAQKVLDLSKVRGKYSQEAQSVIAATPSNKTVIEHAFESGYDAVRTMGGNEIAVKNPTQIKSAVSNTGAFDPANPDIRQDLAIGQDYQYLNPSEFWAVRMTNTAQARFEAKSIWARSLQWLKEALQHLKGALGLKSDHPLLKALDDLIKNGTGEFQSKEMLGSSEVYASIEESGPEEVAGVVMRDVSLAARLLLHPRQIAANHKPFVPVFDTAIKQFEERDRIVSGLGEMAKPYFELTHAQRLNVNKIVEQGRLDRTVYTVADLENGIHHAESGDLVTLDAEEIGAYKSLRRTFNEALSLFRDTMLEEFGFAELIPEQKAAAKLRQMIADGEIEESRIEWARHVAKAIDEIEQAKRTGYAPFNRYGQFVVAVKALPAGVEVQADDGKQFVTGIPEYGDDPLTQIVTDLGGQYDVFRDGWVIDDTRNAVLRALETTLFATKVEVNAFNEWRKQGKDVTAIPEVKAAFDEAKRKYGKAPNARVLAFHITEKAKADDANLSTFDELARISDVDVETWDAVREKLQEAIKAKSFRKHFFGSDNTPGYSTDFERSVADYIIGMSGYLARRKHVKDFDNAIKHIKAPALAKYAEDYRKYVNSPADEFALLKNIGFLYYIAGSTATAVANLTQVPIMTTATLKQFVPHHIVAREVARAWGETLAMFSPTKTGLQMFDPAKVPADVRDVFKTAWEDQLFVPLETLDLMAASSIKTVGGRRTMRALSVTTQAIAYMFMFAERLNRITTFIAAARISRMKVAKDRMRDVVKNDAWARHSIGGRAWGERNFAEWVVDESQYRMGKVNRPTVMRGVGSPLLQFKGYMIQTLEAGYRMAVMHGKGGKPAALAALAMMLMLGGLWVLPGLEDLRDMIEKLYKASTGKDLDLKTEIRQLIARETGSASLAAVANKGIPYATVGVDMSRVGLGNIIPDSALQVAGIPVDLTIARPMRAAEKMAAGKTTEAMSEFLPNFLKNPAMGLQWKFDGLRDKLGTRMMTPGQFDYADVAIKSLGWTPTKVTNRREYTYAESRAERGIDELKRRYTNDLVRAYVHEAEAKDPAEKAEYKADQAKILAKIEEHNKTASPENLIKLDPGTLRRKAAAELSGSAAREGKERKLSRGAAQDRRELFQLNR